MSITITDHQWKAIKTARQWFLDVHDTMNRDIDARYMEPRLGQGGEFFLGGYAGTGKSTVLLPMIESFGLHTSEVGFCAPTGKAAKVMRRKLEDAGASVNTTTIHSLIYIPNRELTEYILEQMTNLEERINYAKKTGLASFSYGDEELSIDQGLAMMVDLDKEMRTAMRQADGPSFSLKKNMTKKIKNEGEGADTVTVPANYKLIVVDEGSMVGSTIADDLSRFGVPVLVLGDPGQLPPVGDRYGYECETPDAFLTEIHRQALDNPIINLATQVREKKPLKEGDYGAVKIVNPRDDHYTLDMESDAMVLCGTNKKRWILTKKIRAALGIKQTGPAQDEPMIFCKNSTRIPSMFNGSIVRNNEDVGELVKGASGLTLNLTDDETGDTFDAYCTQGILEEHYYRKRGAYSCTPRAAAEANKRAEHVDFAHVLTVHKSQGSEWDNVIVHDEAAVFREQASRWMYTAVTRAAKNLVVVL